MTHKAVTIAFWANTFVGVGIGTYLLMSASALNHFLGGVAIAFHVFSAICWAERELR